jgi:hypothetical protein
MSATQQQAAEQALRNRDRLYRNSRAAKRRQYEELFATADGEKLRKFRATLNRFGIDDGDKMVSYVTGLVWLKMAHTDIRAAALEMIGHRIVRIRQLDDPLPDDEPDVFLLCKKALGI